MSRGEWEGGPTPYNKGFYPGNFSLNLTGYHDDTSYFFKMLDIEG